MMVVRSVKGCGLPEEGGELAGAGDGDDAGGLPSLLAQVLPALVEPLLGTPGDGDYARVGALLSALEHGPDRPSAAVVVGGLDQQSACVGRNPRGCNTPGCAGGPTMPTTRPGRAPIPYGLAFPVRRLDSTNEVLPVSGPSVGQRHETRSGDRTLARQ